MTALSHPEAVQRVLDAAEEAGLGARVHASAAGLESWRPDSPLTAVIYTPEAFTGDVDSKRAGARLQARTSSVQGMIG